MDTLQAMSSHEEARRLHADNRRMQKELAALRAEVKIQNSKFKIQNSFISSRPNTSTFETSSLSVCSDSTTGSRPSSPPSQQGRNLLLWVSPLLTGISRRGGRRRGGRRRREYPARLLALGGGGWLLG
ncbi:jg26316 [Pararge aegeria aegeria]|uniref:Jg26316 protein n=1 Tax=Pararge aegeria aegeria TaxID=348720 RepID=A0A8S4R6T8_9NEOP|nr:jg26316 [Pararge aegeria aegeria]